jgi:hypothetical protein
MIYQKPAAVSTAIALPGRIFGMRGFFHSLQPLLKFALGLFALALLGGLMQLVARWIEVPFVVLLITVGIIGLVLYVWLWRKWAEADQKLRDAMKSTKQPNRKASASGAKPGSKQHEIPGPKPQLLKIKGNWQDAVTKSFEKKKPPAG